MLRAWLKTFVLLIGLIRACWAGFYDNRNDTYVHTRVCYVCTTQASNYVESVNVRNVHHEYCREVTSNTPRQVFYEPGVCFQRLVRAGKESFLERGFYPTRNANDVFCRTLYSYSVKTFSVPRAYFTMKFNSNRLVFYLSTYHTTDLLFTFDDQPIQYSMLNIEPWHIVVEIYENYMLTSLDKQWFWHMSPTNCEMTSGMYFHKYEYAIDYERCQINLTRGNREFMPNSCYFRPILSPDRRYQYFHLINKPFQPGESSWILDHPDFWREYCFECNSDLCNNAAQETPRDRYNGIIGVDSSSNKLVYNLCPLLFYLLIVG